MKRKHKFVLCITLCIYLFSVLSIPKKAEAIGAEITALLGGAAYSGSALTGLGTAVGVLGVAGLVVVGGVGLWYLGNDLYNKWHRDKILNKDGSVTVTPEMVQSTQEFIDSYNPSIAQPITANVKSATGFISSVNTQTLDKIIVSTPFDSSFIDTHLVPSWGTDIIPVNNAHTVKADSQGVIKFIYTMAFNGTLFQSSKTFSLGEEFANTNVLVKAKKMYYGFWSTFALKINTDILTVTGSFINSETFTVDTGINHSKPIEDAVLGQSVCVGVRAVPGYNLGINPYESGSISLNPPAINTGSISAQKVIDRYGEGKIITAPAEWGKTIPLEQTKTYNPGIVIPGEIPAVREVDDPITYDPTIPVDPSIPYVPDLSLPGSVSLDFSPLYIKLTDKFPFSLPWDMSNLFHSFQAPAVAPNFLVKFDKQYFLGGGEFEINFDKFSKIAAILRFFVLIGFVLMLIKLTRNMIGG